MEMMLFKPARCKNFLLAQKREREKKKKNSLYITSPNTYVRLNDQNFKGAFI